MQTFTRVGSASLLFAGFVVSLQLAATVVTSAPATTANLQLAATPEPATTANVQLAATREPREPREPASVSPQADSLGNFLSGVTALGVVLVRNNYMVRFTLYLLHVCFYCL